MTDNELRLIVGGAANISGSVLNAISRLINTLLDLGRSVGSALRSSKTGNMC